MSLDKHFEKAESALIKALEAKRAAIDDRTGKGSSTELIVEHDLLLPHLPIHLRCAKGAVVSADSPDCQSPAIDRIISDPSAAPPLVFDQAHSIFPIEAVCGLVEVTMRLDASKLRQDFERMVPVKAMRMRRFLEPVPYSRTKMQRVKRKHLSPRSFIVGLPAEDSWSPQTIATTLRSIQKELGAPTHVHGLYVIGIGYFETLAVESDAEPRYRIRAWTGPDRLFRFTTGFRQSLDNWHSLPGRSSVDLHDYVSGKSELLVK